MDHPNRNANMSKPKHLTQRVLEKFASWQKKLQPLQTLLAAREGLPLLTAPAPHGPDHTRFQDPIQGLVAWPDKKLQAWHAFLNLQADSGRKFALDLSFELRQADLPIPRMDSAKITSARLSLIDPHKGHEAGKSAENFKVWNKSGLNKSRVFSSDRFHVEVDGWFLKSDSREFLRAPFTLFSHAPGLSAHLTLQPSSTVHLLGQDGYIQSNADQSFASFWPGFACSGTVFLDEKPLTVHGTGMVLHEKQTRAISAVEEATHVHDWLVINGVFLNLSSEKVYSFGKITSTERSEHLVGTEIEVIDEEFWKSPKTGMAYPVRRLVRISKEGFSSDLHIRAATNDQEVENGVFSFFPEWRGLVSVTGTQNGVEVDSTGFMWLRGRGVKSFSFK